MDVLPVQATSVSCERVFSSAKETDAKRRNRLSPEMREALQILKQSFLRERLNFTSDWLAKESDCLEPTEDASTALSGDPESSSGVLATVINDFVSHSEVSET